MIDHAPAKLHAGAIEQVGCCDDALASGKRRMDESILRGWRRLHGFD